jgi:hypothetical protein
MMQPNEAQGGILGPYFAKQAAGENPERDESETIESEQISACVVIPFPKSARVNDDVG